jgi:hypothetical protein
MSDIKWQGIEWREERDEKKERQEKSIFNLQLQGKSTN